MSVVQLQNIGKVSGQWLIDIGIYTREDLERVGVLDAYLQIKAIRGRAVSLNLLWALQGGLLGLPLIELPTEVKEQLLDALARRSE